MSFSKVWCAFQKRKLSKNRDLLMKALCITGADAATLQAVAQPFYEAGMSAPESIVREKEINFSVWHQHTLDRTKLKQPVGALWESLALDLLIANLDSPCWGWTEESSVYSLDFWADIDPSIHFILICTRPEDSVEQALYDDQFTDVQECVNHWYQKHRALLDFYLEYPDRCLLLDATDAQRHLTRQFQLAQDNWKLPLDKQNLYSASEQENASPGQGTSSEAFRFAALEAIRCAHADIRNFYLELRAAQYPLSTDANAAQRTQDLLDWLATKTDFASLNALVKELGDHRNSARQSEQQLLLERQEKTDSLQQLQKLKSELEILKSKTLIDAVFEKDLKEQKQESELMLLQISQLQEDLESTFSEKESLSAKLKALQQQPRRDPKVVTELDEQKQENDLLVLQLTQLQEELEHYYLNYQAIKKNYKALEVKNGVLLRELQDMQKRQGQGLLSRFVKESPLKLKYDDIQLTREQVNNDYEHLQIQLTNLSFGEKQITSWTIRLSCAAVTASHFGAQPKLEIPEQSDQLLDSWYRESEDEFGPKYELRFALPNSMDVGVWKKLLLSDRQLLRALINQLPEMLAESERRQVLISRDWSDWVTAAGSMKRIVAKRGRK